MNTFIKCNPTLLGYDFARGRLDRLGFDYVAFDDHHFREDLQWADAVPMFGRLSALCAERGLEFGLKLTLDHCTEGAKIADILAAEGYPAFVGPNSGGTPTKMEVMDKKFETPAILHRAGVPFAIITDDPVISLEALSLCAGLAVRHGLPEEEAWKAITIYPARYTDIADRVGSLEPGKDADLVLWNSDPLRDIAATVHLTMVDGAVVYREA